MDWGRFGIWGLVATLAIGGVAVVADALVETDEERVGELADALVGPRVDRRADAVISLVDATRVPLTVRAQGRTSRWDERDGDPADAVREALSPLLVDELALVDRTVRVEGERADVSVRVRSGEDVVDVLLGLRRDGQAWLVGDVRVID